MPDKLLHYDVLEKLGEGAKSTIYAVSDPVTKQVYALKHVVREDAKDIRFVEQMEAEFEISRQLNHPNLRRTYELKISKKLLLKVTEAFLVMELVDGKAMDVRPPTGILQTLDIFIQAAQGLQAMHTLGFVHCDIKPNNILYNDAGKVKVIDYGQSCKIGTVKERIQGTPDYIAPEQVHRKPVSHKTDIYNLGATIYWALTAKNIPTLYTVGRGDNSFLVADRIPTPMELNPKVPLALNNLVMECIAIKADKRPASMENVIHRLEIAKHLLTKSGNPIPPSPISRLDEEEIEEFKE